MVSFQNSVEQDDDGKGDLVRSVGSDEIGQILVNDSHQREVCEAPSCRRATVGYTQKRVKLV